MAAAEGRTNEGNGWFVAAALALIVAGAATLRFADLGRRSLWIDEGYSWFQASGSLADVVTRTATDNYPPLHNFVVWAVIRLFGDGEAAMRAPSAVFATLNVVAVFLLARKLAGPAAGLMAALLLALSPMEIEQAHQVRMYAQFSLAGTLYLWTALRALDRPTWPEALAAAAAGVAVLYTHIYGTFLFASVAAVVFLVLLFRGPLPAVWRWTVAQALALLVFAPWLVILARRAGAVVEEGFWIPVPDGAYLLDNTLNILPAPAAILVAVVVATSLVLWPWRRAGTGALVVLLAILLPFAIAYVLSMTLRPILIDRYMIFAGPFALALAAALLARLPAPWLLRGGVVLVVAVLLAPLALAAVRYDPPWFSDWRSLVAKQKELQAAGDATIAWPQNVIPAYRYYAGPVSFAAEPATREAVVAPADIHGRIWIAVRGTDQQLLDDIVAAYESAGFRTEQRLEFKNCRLLAFSRP